MALVKALVAELRRRIRSLYERALFDRKRNMSRSTKSVESVEG